MGLMKKFFSQTRKPEGTLGKMMLKGMNSGHAKLADGDLSICRSSLRKWLPILAAGQVEMRENC